MRNPEARINFIISKENFVNEKILGKINFYEFVKSVCYKFQSNY